MRSTSFDGRRLYYPYRPIPQHYPMSNMYPFLSQPYSPYNTPYPTPYPKPMPYMKPPQMGMNSFMNSFKKPDGNIDFNKMMDTAGQVMSTMNQMSSLFKGVTQIFKT